MSGAQPQVVDLDLDEVKQGLARGTLVLVDVREPLEFAAGHFPGSVSHPLSSFDPDQLPVSEGRRVVFSCAAGVRSVRAIEISQAAGFHLREHYRGGFKEWAGMGEEVEW